MKELLYLKKFFFLLVIILLIALIYRERKLSLWHGQSRFAWIEQRSETVQVFLAMPKEKRLIVWDIPPQTEITAEFGFGQYRLNKIFTLGELENQGGRLLMRTAQSLLGVRVDGWQVGRRTNLSINDRLRLFWFKKVTAANRTKTVNYPETVAIFDEAIAGEKLTVAILNASGVDGAATNLSRLINNLGATVTRVANRDEASAVSYLTVKNKDLLQQQTTIALSKTLSVAAVQVADTEREWSDIVIVLGRDFTTL
jgi:hypothetical protein